MKEPVFFDLDHTLWDFETNSRETLAELIRDFGPHFSRPLSISEFFPVYAPINVHCWELYRQHAITQAELRIKRFYDAFETLGIPPGDWIHSFAARYTEECPKKGGLFPGALEALQIISEHFSIHIITNGFLDVQHIKLEYSGLQPYVQAMVTSEEAGYRKPDARIFHYALHHSGTRKSDPWYIGDDYEADMLGASAAGLTPLFFNPENKPNPFGFTEIQHHAQLPALLGL